MRNKEDQSLYYKPRLPKFISIDVDNGEVTLAEDGDLVDVLKKGLDPIWITVKLKIRMSGIMGGLPDTLKDGQVLRDARASPTDRWFGSFGSAAWRCWYVG